MEKGELSLGVPCAPFTLSQYSIANGKLKKREITVTGRKFPLEDLRKKLLASQERYRCLQTKKSAKCQHKIYVIRCHSGIKIYQIVKMSYVNHSRCFSILAPWLYGMTMQHCYLYACTITARDCPPTLGKHRNQERIFSQARKTATATTNRHPQNISTLMIHLQAKTEVTATVQNSESITKASKHIPPYNGTTVEKIFLRTCLKSWKQHLWRISPFLAPGPGVWWSILGRYTLYDGDTDEDSHNGPPLLHY